MKAVLQYRASPGFAAIIEAARGAVPVAIVDEDDAAGYARTAVLNALAAVARRTDRRSGGSALPRDGDLGGDRRSEGHASRDREEAKHDHQ